MACDWCDGEIGEDPPDGSTLCRECFYGPTDLPHASFFDSDDEESECVKCQALRWIHNADDKNARMFRKVLAERRAKRWTHYATLLHWIPVIGQMVHARMEYWCAWRDAFFTYEEIQGNEL